MRASPAHSSRHAALALVVCALVLLGIQVLASHVPFPRTVGQFRVAAYGMQLAFFDVVIVAIVIAARWWNAPWQRVVLAIVCALVVSVALSIVGVEPAADVAKVVFAVSCGVLIVRAFERPWWLIPICLLVPLSDAWSVFSSRGVTHHIVKRAAKDPAWIRWPSIGTPIGGMPYDHFSRIGIVDVLFAAVLLGCAVRWPHIGRTRAAFFVVLGFLATSVIVFEGAARAIPALPLICGMFLVAVLPAVVADARAEWRARHGNPAER